MEIEFLGTGAGTPSQFRNTSSLVLKLLDEINEVWMFDCGEATQHQILKTNIKPRKITKIFITHLHGDHIFGLPGFLSSRSFQGGDDGLIVYGPLGIKNFIENALKVSDTHVGYHLKYVEFEDECLDKTIIDDDKFLVKVHRLDHRITSFGYRVEEKDHIGKLKVDKLRDLNIPPGSIYGQIKNGQDVELDNGTVLKSSDFIGQPQPGRTVSILGDSKSSNKLIPFVSESDILIHESTFNRNESKIARNYQHATNIQGANLAKNANVKTLLLNHISGRYLGRQLSELEQDAQSVFPSTKLVKDFDTFQVDFPAKKI